MTSAGDRYAATRLLWSQPDILAQARYRAVALLAVAAPAIGELLSGSAPPTQFFVPWVFCLFVAFYGANALLVRELVLRWGKGWVSILILGAAFGVLQEGLATRAFFDPAWHSLGPMTGHGRALGVNWIWTLDAILYHATFSTALPILLVYQVFPQSRRLPWLRTRELVLTAAVFLLGAAVFLYSGKDRYPAPPGLLVACVAAIAVLCVGARLAHSVRLPWKGRETVSPRRFALLAFFSTLGLVLQIYAVPLAHAPALTAAVLAGLAGGTAYQLTRWLRRDVAFSPFQECGLLVGALGCFAALSFFQEINPSQAGRAMGASVVGLGTAIGLSYLWRRARAAAAVTPLPLAPITAAITAPAFGGATGAAAAVALEPVAPATVQSDIPLAWRMFEIGCSAVVLLLAAPIIMVLAIIVRRGSPGRALFFQERVGMNLKPFRFVKFRTLYADARHRFPGLYAYRYSPQDLQNLKFKLVNDPRVTPQGKWMRKTTLDELPNFWNVLRGEMALVGPRPEIPEMLPYYTREMLLKFSVRPGITGLAQIAGRGHLGFYETVKLDLEYVERRSVILDVKILLLTVYKAITQEGAF